MRCPVSTEGGASSASRMRHHPECRCVIERTRPGLRVRPPADFACGSGPIDAVRLADSWKGGYRAGRARPSEWRELEHPMSDEREPLIRNISDTARWAAVFRARETERPNAVFRDPFARRLAGARGEEIADAMPSG